jgi:putative MFS transporter
VAGFNWIWAAFGVTIIGFLIPDMRQEWTLSSSQVSLVASITLLGMMVGSVIAGRVADRIGRRITLTWISVYLAVTAAASAVSWSFSVMLVLRLLYGIGLGAVLPVASTLISEYSPARYRGRLTVLLNGFWGIGQVLSAMAGFWIVPYFGWRLPLVLAAVGILAVPLNLLYLPESLRFLLSHKQLATAQRVASQIDTGEGNRPFGSAQKTPASVPSPAKKQLDPSESIWSRLYRQRTLALWLMWFALNFTFQGVFIWLPSILVASGNSMAQSSLFTLVITIGYLPGTLVAAYLADSASRRFSLAVFMIAWGLFAVAFGFSHAPAATLILGFLVATGNGAAWGMAYPVTTELYPTRMRAAATGWASGFGRIGGIIAPFVVGLMIQWGAGNVAIFALLGIVPAITTLVLFGLSQQTTGRALEEITS